MQLIQSIQNKRGIFYLSKHGQIGKYGGWMEMQPPCNSISNIQINCPT